MVKEQMRRRLLQMLYAVAEAARGIHGFEITTVLQHESRASKALEHRQQACSTDHLVCT